MTTLADLNSFDAATGFVNSKWDRKAIGIADFRIPAKFFAFAEFNGAVMPRVWSVACAGDFIVDQADVALADLAAEALAVSLNDEYPTKLRQSARAMLKRWQDIGAPEVPAQIDWEAEILAQLVDITDDMTADEVAQARRINKNLKQKIRDTKKRMAQKANAA